MDKTDQSGFLNHESMPTTSKFWFLKICAFISKLNINFG